MPAVRPRSPRPVPANLRTRVAAPRRRADPPPSPPPAKKRRLASVRGTYATRARREKAEVCFREDKQAAADAERDHPRRPGETHAEWRRRVHIPNDETLRAFAETDAGIGILEYESREAMRKDLRIP